MSELRCKSHWEHLKALADRIPTPADARTWLLATLARNSGTEFGRRYSFGTIRSIRDYRAAVPVHGYEHLAPYIARMAEGEEDVLFQGRPAAFECTSGSGALNAPAGQGGGAARYIPYSVQSLEDFRGALLPWLADLIAVHDLSGPAYWSISPALRREERTAGGIPVGLADYRYLGEETRDAFSALSAVPFWVGAVEDAAVWRLATLYHLLRAGELAFLCLWSPSFFLRLLAGLEEQAESLLLLLRDGGSLHGHSLEADTGAARRFSAYLQSGDTRVLWPRLALVSAWADASAAPYARLLRQRLPQAHLQPKGLLCTEGVVSVPDVRDRALALRKGGFLEFADRDGSVLLEEELVEGQSYRVIMTTGGGLYRYANGDQVRCLGRAGERMRIVFVGRTELHSDLVGEKLTDVFVTACLSGLPGFAMLLPVTGEHPCYRLLLDARDYGGSRGTRAAEAAAWQVESALRDNPQYAYAVRMGQLGETRPLLAEEPLEQYLRWAEPLARAGQSVIKVPALCANPDFIPW